jgi:AcrR family transcriptional regulator
LTRVTAIVTGLKPQARSQRKAKGDGHLRRAEILSAAERIFVECGYEGATIRRIADEVGVSSTALYMHFRDKSEILVEISAQMVQRVIDANSQLIATEMDSVLRVRRMLEAYIQFGFENINAYQLVFCPSSAEIPPDQQDALNALGARCYMLFTSAVATMRDEDRLITDNVHAAAQVLWPGVHGLIALMVMRQSFEWEDRDLLTGLMLDTLFRGMVKG